MTYCSFCNAWLQSDWDHPYDLDRDLYREIKVSEILTKADHCILCKAILRRLEEHTALLNINDRVDYSIVPFCFEDSEEYDYILDGEGCVAHRGQIRLYPTHKDDDDFHGFIGPVLLTEREEISKHQPHIVLQLQPYIDVISTRSSNMVESSSKTYASGRFLHEEAHLPLLSHWINLCRSTHGETCSASILPSTAKRELQSLLVIDVDRMSIVEAPPKCRYVALSYCWGKVPVVKHLIANSEELRKKDAFRYMSLPETIRDAITVVHGVGEKYLWVDALCIVQDDPTTQQAQLAQMGLVYSLAAFTITAAAGDDADSGLPGIRHGSRSFHQEIFETGSQKVMSVIDGPYYGGVEGSEWNQRAWTLQEKVLSKKNLIFTPQQIYWECCEATWQEETLLETESDVVFRQGKPTVTGPADVRFSQLDRKNPEELYTLLLNSYLQRQLSFSADILNAFSGICQVFEVISGGSFFWGLPEASFDKAICWTLEGGSKRNHQSCIKYDSHGRSQNIEFPSWSWAAWFGTERKAWINWETPGNGRTRPGVAYNRANDGSEIAFYTCAKSNFPVRLGSSGVSVTSSQTAGFQEGLAHTRISEGSKHWKHLPQEVTTSHISASHLTTSNDGHLFFWTSVARLPIMRQPLPDWHVGMPLGMPSGNGIPKHYTLDIRGLVSPAFLESTDHIPFRCSAEMSAVPSWVTEKYILESTEDWFMRDCLVVGRDKFEDLTLMVVEWMENVAYRIGIAHIPEEDWVCQERSWKLVTLG